MFQIANDSIQAVPWATVAHPRLRVGPTWDGRLRVFCVETGLEYQRPGWHLVGV